MRSPDTFEEWNRETGARTLPERAGQQPAVALARQGECLLAALSCKHAITRLFQDVLQRAPHLLLILALWPALLVATPAAHADGTRTKILRDCQDDGILQGDYTAAQMRDARDNQPAELLEYSDCGDVLTRAISDKIGFTSVTTQDMWKDHPEKVCAFTEEFTAIVGSCPLLGARVPFV